MCTSGHEKWKKSICLPCCTTKTALSFHILKNLNEAFPLNDAVHPPPRVLSLSSGWKIKWNQRPNVTWEAVRPSSGQPWGVKAMSGTTESLSDVLSVSQGHCSTWQHGKRRGQCVCADLRFLQGWEESIGQASPLSTSHPFVVFADLPMLPYWVSHNMSKHRQEVWYSGLTCLLKLHTDTGYHRSITKWQRGRHTEILTNSHKKTQKCMNM